MKQVSDDEECGSLKGNITSQASQWCVISLGNPDQHFSLFYRPTNQSSMEETIKGLINNENYHYRKDLKKGPNMWSTQMWLKASDPLLSLFNWFQIRQHIHTISLDCPSVLQH